VEHAARLREMYAAFNACDIDALLEQMTADVDWPNAWEGGRVHGHDEVRDYWSRQWSMIDPSVEPVAFNVRPEGRVAVEVDQVVAAQTELCWRRDASSTSTPSATD
jgi:ketosteroid isomerase-like protein